MVPDLHFEYSNCDGKENTDAAVIFALLQSELAVFCLPAALVVCSRLDLDAKLFSCRLAFYGNVDMVVGSSSEELNTLSSIHRRAVSLADMRIGRSKIRGGLWTKWSCQEAVAVQTEVKQSVVTCS